MLTFVLSTASITNNRIDSGTGAFLSDCDATTYCHENNTCAYRGCRKDEVSAVTFNSFSGGEADNRCSPVSLRLQRRCVQGSSTTLRYWCIVSGAASIAAMLFI